MSTKPKLFAWDFHGTLEEGTEVGFAQLLKIVAKEFKLPRRIDIRRVRKLFGSSITEYLKTFFPEASDELVVLMRNKIAEIQTQEHLALFVKPAPNATDVIRRIKSARHKNIVVSNSQQNHIETLINVVGMANLFDGIFAIDKHYKNFKADTVKEKARAIKKFAKENRLSEIIVIGDRPGDIEAGLAVGALTIQYERQGFPKFKTGAHHVISDLREVLRHI